MNIQEYISSGILEAFLLGELSPSKEQEVLDMVAAHPEVKSEFDRLQETLESLAQHNAVPPPGHLKASVLSELEKFAEPPSPNFPDPQTIPPSENPNGKWRKGALMAALLGLAICAIVVFNCFKKSKTYEDNLLQLAETNNQLSADNAQLAQELSTVRENLNIIIGPEFQEIEMAGLPISPSSFAEVFWNEQNNEVYLNTGSLPAPPDDQQYQLWAIVEGTPINAGVFELTDIPALIKMQSIDGASAFAITLEKRGGLQSPTLEQMYVIGEVSSF
ncbi:MAG: anti-sigma factor [Saprospiraceae bacterium]|nr:anti-sigma factor [Saprospiraceae bacterium]